MKNPTLKFKRGMKYQVEEDYLIQTRIVGFTVKAKFYELSPDGMLLIRDGYAWDGASGTTIDTMSSIIGSLVHDVFYQMMREGELPHDPCFTEANLELERLCVNDGMWAWRAGVWFRFVEGFGNAHAAVQPEEIFTAPA